MRSATLALLAAPFLLGGAEASSKYLQACDVKCSVDTDGCGKICLQKSTVTISEKSATFNSPASKKSQITCQCPDFGLDFLDGGDPQQGLYAELFQGYYSTFDYLDSVHSKFHATIVAPKYECETTFLESGSKGGADVCQVATLPAPVVDLAQQVTTAAPAPTTVASVKAEQTTAPAPKASAKTSSVIVKPPTSSTKKSTTTSAKKSTTTTKKAATTSTKK